MVKKTLNENARIIENGKSAFVVEGDSIRIENSPINAMKELQTAAVCYTVTIVTEEGQIDGSCIF